MPSSFYTGKVEIKDWVQNRNDIKRIIDFGPGCGTYPKLLGYKYYWTGVEIFEPYVKQYHLKIMYDKIIIGDLRNVDWPEADLLIFGDVLEHLTKEDVLHVIEKTKPYPHVIVSLPLGSWPQGPSEGNEAEAHVSTWSLEDAIQVLQPTVTFNFPALVGDEERHIGVFIR